MQILHRDINQYLHIIPQSSDVVDWATEKAWRQQKLPIKQFL